ncbi:MAG TPA: metal-dependent transcriptional regulator [Oscillospiraceae bacterium]|nr:metal-dependent transcriptional regulator [Oscillospiraceae bacterium]HPK36608.1 metal-dependent transcriptional regulator [Oscillospiraceae bacterium]HPR76886.1 metal-dependent transcriptional regulator [Oscillospiraceae bacterium]
MALLESGEMYLEDILILREKQRVVRAVDIANYTGYSKPSISRAVGLLKKDGLIEVDGEGYITLKPAGEKIAEKILERHRLLTEFLVKIGVSPEVAARDACKIEHDICDETFEKLKAHMSRVKKEI